MTKLDDPQIRAALKKSPTFKPFQNSKVFDERWIEGGTCIIDIMVVDDNLHGFEIKSEVDSLQRLAKQIPTYNKVFDYCSIVIAEKHYPKFNEKFADVAGHWGIILVKNNNGCAKLRVLKRPTKNKAVDLQTLCQWMWRVEMYSVLKEHYTSKELRGLMKDKLRSMLIKTLKPQDLKKEVRLALTNRPDWQTLKNNSLKTAIQTA